MGEWGLPRQTGNLLSDMHALRVALQTAETIDQMRACHLRAQQLTERVNVIFGPLRKGLEAMARAFADWAEAIRPTVQAFADLHQVSRSRQVGYGPAPARFRPPKKLGRPGRTW